MNLDNRIPGVLCGNMSRKRAPTARSDDLHMAESMLKLTKLRAKTCQHETAKDTGEEMVNCN